MIWWYHTSPCTCLQKCHTLNVKIILFLTSRMLAYKILTLHYLTLNLTLLSCWTFYNGTYPRVSPKTAALCGEHDSVRSRHSARPMRAARRPAVQHQPASLPPRRLLLLQAHARVFTPFQHRPSRFLLSVFEALKAPASPMKRSYVH